MKHLFFLSLLIFSLNIQASQDLQILKSKSTQEVVRQQLSAIKTQPLLEKTLLTALKKYARNGDARAQLSLANMYYYGINARKDAKLALYWYSQVAESGYPTAQFMMAEFYDKGIGVEKNAKKSLLWYKKSAKQGMKKAQYKIAQMFADGSGGEVDYKQSADWYQAVAESGDALAQLKLAQLYEQGLGVKKDEKLAQYWYEKAAVQLNVEAQYRLAKLFERNSMLAQAQYWYQRANKKNTAYSITKKDQPNVDVSKHSAAPSLQKIAQSLTENAKILKQRTTALKVKKSNNKHE